jgi:hypothetical protein
MERGRERTGRLVMVQLLFVMKGTVANAFRRVLAAVPSSL